MNWWWQWWQFYVRGVRDILVMWWCEGNEEHVSSPPAAGWVLEIEFWSLLQFQHCPPKYYILLSLQHYFCLRTLYTGSSMNLLYWCLLRNFTLLLHQSFPRLDVVKTLHVTLLHQRSHMRGAARICLKKRMSAGFVDLVENDLWVVENEGWSQKLYFAKMTSRVILTLGCVGCSLHDDKLLCKRCILG